MAREPWYIRYVRTRQKNHSRVKNQDIISFFRQLNTLIKGGSNLLNAIRMAAEQSESRTMRATGLRIAEQVEGGLSLHQAFMRYPKIFKESVCQLIRAGESSGTMTTILDRLVLHMEAQERTRSKVLGALVYPAFLLLMSFNTIVVLFTKVIPSFADFFKSVGGRLPTITQTVLDISHFLTSYGLYMAAGAAAAAFFFYRFIQNPRGKLIFDYMTLTIPGVGDLLVESAMQAFAANLSLLLRAGLPLLEALEIVESIYGRQMAYREAIKTARYNVYQGRDLASSLDDTRLFTQFVVYMSRVGEESGQLATVLAEADVFYGERVESQISRLTAMVEPAIIIFMGAIVGVVLAAIYIPIFSLSSRGR